ncbi:Mur ligase family protein [Natronobacterium texcoconense]|uniref:Mur ligase middle domain-containing protein n=1 Tax=Natronobacterium texcoconense TaxID=1095778 RepID=A0A1H1I3S1_NATTX|nr:Mur ligase family protein [Natronobacterium texcoconense]SDR31986.1 Mur ligase middle domain-containing protein [Natronobacterium texcoconense]
MAHLNLDLPIAEPVTRIAKQLTTPLTRGIAHRQRLSDIDVRIVVSGTRGKSGTTERLHDVLRSRGYDVYAKITGNHPTSLYNGDRHDVERGERVTLYENVRELRKYAPADALILENQGITDYTTRMMNEAFGKPDVLVVTNVRQDHRDTLGGSRADIARAFARATPEGTHVVSGEQDPRLQAYLERELEAIGATITHVGVPENHRDLPGAETVYAIDEVLSAIGEEPLSDRIIDDMLEEFRLAWTSIPNGRVFNAADVNDVESTELVRQTLVDGTDEVVQPLLYLRRDRRARTASFRDYLESLADRGSIEQVRVAGGHADLFAEKTTFPVVVHDEESEPADAVLEEAIADGWPVLVMGNTVAEFMRDLDDAIQRRADAVDRRREDEEAAAAENERSSSDERRRNEPKQLPA